MSKKEKPFKKPVRKPREKIVINSSFEEIIKEAARGNKKKQ
jgi:hypothetical protein